VAGILIGGAMAATSLTGRRMVEAVGGELAVIEARLALGATAQAALAPIVRRAVTTGLIPVIDQTKNVGLVSLPGTFVGLILGGASPAEAARLQLTVLLALLGVEMIAALVVAELIGRAVSWPGERVVAPGRGA
jgi:putative ABC transport system permease protein